MFDDAELSADDKKSKLSEVLKRLIKSMHLADNEGGEDKVVAATEEERAHSADGGEINGGELVEANEENSMDEEDPGLSKEEIAELLKSGNKVPKKKGTMSMVNSHPMESKMSRMVKESSLSKKKSKRG